jgi:hypothetical protein
VHGERARAKWGRMGLALVASASLSACLGGPAGTAGSGQSADSKAATAAPSRQPPRKGASAKPRTAVEARPAAEGGAFPSPKELAQLGEAPVPENLFDLDVRDLESWQLAGPFPQRIEAVPYTEAGPWAALMDDAARRRPGLVLPTEAMYCVAREVGRFFLATRSQPSEGLRRYITARCHATEARVAIGYVDGPVSQRHSDAQVYGHWRDAVRRSLESRLAGGPRTAGIWYGREGDHAVVMQAFGHREIHVEPFSPVPAADGRIEIRGELLTPAGHVRALVNRGRFGVSPCESTPDAIATRFAFVCEVDPRDPAALISLSVTPPERLLSSNVLHVLARPEGGLESVYRVASYGASQPIVDPDAAEEDFVDLLNAVRRLAGLTPVTLDPGQSETASELAPAFFASIFGRSPEYNAEMVILGMLAGWSVDGIVQSGHFTASWVLRSNDLQRLLAAALEEPGGRETLLAAEIDRIALGTLLESAEGHESMAAIFGSYALFSEEDHTASVNAVMEKLGHERSQRGLGPPRSLDQVSPLCSEAASRVASGETPRDVMRDLLGETVEILQQSATGWIAEVRDLDELSFPDEYLTRPSLGLALAISHREEPGEPWGRWVVMAVVADTEAHGT